MSIDRAGLALAEMSARELGPWLAVALVPVAAWVAWRIGAFRPRSVAGPERFDAKLESPAALWLSALFGFVAWIGSQAVYAQAMHGPELDAMRRAAASQDDDAPTTRPEASILQPRETIVLAIGSQALGLAVLLLTDVRLLRPGGLTRLGLTRAQSPPRTVRLALIGAIIALPLTWLVAMLTEWTWRRVGFRPPEDHQMIRMLRESPPVDLKLLVTVSAAVCAPIFEEVLFRGHLQTALSALIGSTVRQADPSSREAGSLAWPRWAAIAVTAMAFALVHEAGWMVPPLFVLAVCLGYAYERTGNLWVPIVMHALFNAASVTVVLMS